MTLCMSVLFSLTTTVVLFMTRQTRDVEPMLVSCWATVCEAGPIRNQHRLNVSCLPRSIRELRTSIKVIDHYICMFLILVVPQYLCNRRGAFWVKMCPAVRTQWSTPLIFWASINIELNLNFKRCFMFDKLYSLLTGSSSLLWKAKRQ